MIYICYVPSIYIVCTGAWLRVRLQSGPHIYTTCISIANSVFGIHCHTMAIKVDFIGWDYSSDDPW